jgi:hypothetical protein
MRSASLAGIGMTEPHSPAASLKLMISSLSAIFESVSACLGVGNPVPTICYVSWPMSFTKALTHRAIWVHAHEDRWISWMRLHPRDHLRIRSSVVLCSSTRHLGQRMFEAVRRKEHGDPSDVSVTAGVGPQPLDELFRESQGKEADNKKLWGSRSLGR